MSSALDAGADVSRERCVPGYPRNRHPHPGTQNRNMEAGSIPLFQVFQGISILDNIETKVSLGLALCLRDEYNVNTLEHLEHPGRGACSIAVFCSRVRWNRPAPTRRFEVMT